jgi:hypothetical protein
MNHIIVFIFSIGTLKYLISMYQCQNHHLETLLGIVPTLMLSTEEPTEGENPISPLVLS